MQSESTDLRVFCDPSWAFIWVRLRAADESNLDQTVNRQGSTKSMPPHLRKISKSYITLPSTGLTQARSYKANSIKYLLRQGWYNSTLSLRTTIPKRVSRIIRFFSPGMARLKSSRSSSIVLFPSQLPFLTNECPLRFRIHKCYSIVATLILERLHFIKSGAMLLIYLCEGPPNSE